MSRPSLAMISLGATIILGSLLAFALAEFDWNKAKTAVLAGGGSGSVMLIVGLIAIKVRPFLYVGTFLTFVYVGVFASRAKASIDKEGPTYLIILFIVFAVAALVALIMELITWPRQRTSDATGTTQEPGHDALSTSLAATSAADRDPATTEDSNRGGGH